MSSFSKLSVALTVCVSFLHTMTSRSHHNGLIANSTHSTGTVTTLCFAKPGVRCDGKVHNAAPSGTSDQVVECGGVQYSALDAIGNATTHCHVVGDGNYDYWTACSLSVFLGS